MNNNELPPPTTPNYISSEQQIVKHGRQISVKSKNKHNLQCGTQDTKEQNNLSSSQCIKRRLKWIDAVRGFVMFIVVFQHIRAFGLNLYSSDGHLPFVYLYFFLTTFFLVSGFLSGGMMRVASITDLCQIVRNKFSLLIIPTCLFWLAYNLVATKNSSMGEWGFPGGYWFTYSLFLISFAIVLIAYICNKLRCRYMIEMLLAIGIGLQLLKILCSSQIDSGIFLYLRTRQFCTYFLYFAIGLWMSMNKTLTFKVIENQNVRTILIGGTVVLLLARYSMTSLFSRIILEGLDFVLSIASTLTVFSIFYLTKAFWDSSSIVAKFLETIGRKSLDVYMLQYFFIPALPVTMSCYFKSANNSIIELAIVGIITVLVVMVCLLASNLLRLSQPLGRLLFSKKD